MDKLAQPYELLCGHGLRQFVMETIVCHACSSRAGAFIRVPLFSVQTKG
jgi:hypothetical protein